MKLIIHLSGKNKELLYRGSIEHKFNSDIAQLSCFFDTKRIFY